jgi:gluconokinase
MLAGRLGWAFEDGDDLHPAANVAKMRAGHPLTDADRLPWLHAVAGWMDARIAAGKSGVIACSALRQAARDMLLDGRPSARLVFLDVDEERLRQRLLARQGHFFPESLLRSQLASVDPPAPGPQVLIQTEHGQPSDTVDEIISWLAEGARDEAQAGPA